MAELRVYDPLSSWECYILAINPDDHDHISCIYNSHIVGPQVDEASSLADLQLCYNREGESPIVDIEYRPRRAAELFKRLSDKHGS